MPVIRQSYMKETLFDILSPLEDRLGQLGEGALSTVGATLDLGADANLINLEVGDAFFFISDADELSTDQFNEIVIGNPEEFLIDSIAGRNVTLDHAWVSEPNEAERFFEYKVRRRFPQRDFTFARTDQTDFSSDIGPLLYVNGLEVAPVLTNPAGENTLATWSGGTILFVPLGSGRYRAEPRITIDANIEFLVPDTLEDVEIRLTNIDVAADVPLWVADGNQESFLSWMKARVEIHTKILGQTYAQGHKGVDVRIVVAKPDEQDVQAGSNAELFVTLVVGQTEELFQTDGAAIYCDARALVDNSQAFFILAENIGPGVVRVSIPAADLTGGEVLRCQMVIYPGGVISDVIRTNTFTLPVLS